MKIKFIAIYRYFFIDRPSYDSLNSTTWAYLGLRPSYKECEKILNSICKLKQSLSRPKQVQTQDETVQYDIYAYYLCKHLSAAIRYVVCTCRDLLNFGRASTGAHVLDSMYMNDVMHFTSMRHG